VRHFTLREAAVTSVRHRRPKRLALQSDDLDRELKEGLSLPDEWSGLRSCYQRDTGLHVALRREQPTERFFGCGRFWSLAEGLFQFIRSRRVVLPLLVEPVSTVTMASLELMPEWIASPAAGV
jgi:hypothetical protein